MKPRRRTQPTDNSDVTWRRAEVVTVSGDRLPAWVLMQYGREVLTAVSSTHSIEPVTKEDRKLIGEALAALR